MAGAARGACTALPVRTAATTDDVPCVTSTAVHKERCRAAAAAAVEAAAVASHCGSGFTAWRVTPDFCG